MAKHRIVDLSAEEPSPAVDNSTCRTRPTAPVAEEQLTKIEVVKTLRVADAGSAAVWTPRDRIAMMCTTIAAGSLVTVTTCSIVGASAATTTAAGSIGTAAITAVMIYFRRKR